MTIVRQQGPVHGRSSSSSVSCVFANTPAIGNVIVAVVTSGDFSGFKPVSSISQSGVNWSVAPAGKIAGPAQYDDGSSDLMNAEVWLGIITGAGASKTVAVSLSGGSPAEGTIVQACEYSGVKITGTVTDGANTYGNKNQLAQTNSITTANASDLLIGVWCVYENGGQNDTPYMIDHYSCNGLVTYPINGYMLERIVSSTDTYNLNSTTGGNCVSSGCIVALKAGATTKTVTYPSDVILKGINPRPYLIDIDFKGTSLKPYNVDSDFKATAQQLYSIDASFFGQTFTTFDIDVFIRNIVSTNTNMYSIDTLFNSPYPYKIDTDLKRKNVKVTNLTDADFKKYKINKTALIDTIFSKVRKYSIDTLLKMLRVSVQYAIDVDFKMYKVPTQYIIDSRFIKTYKSTYAIDILMAASNFSNPYLVDTLLGKLAISESIGVDVSLLSNIPPIPPIYTQPTLRFVNPNGDLWCFPLTWKETQNCKPAIRPVPLAESEFLDADSYVLKAREIEVTFRISDSEKALLEEIYGFADDKGANDFTDIYLFYNFVDESEIHPKPPASVPQYTWHYTAWLSDKEYKYEYASQDGRYIRWWTVTLTINVESFSGSSANEPEYDNPFSMAVTLDGHQLVHILDFERSDKHPPMLPEWVNQPAEVDSYIWNECVLDITYRDRMSNDEKYLMDLTLQNHKLVHLADYVHVVLGNVWVSSISAEYDPSNWAKPWVVDVAIQANNSDVDFSAVANLSVDSWGVDAIETHIGPDHEGKLYMDEQTTQLSLSSSMSVQFGVHTFYFFLPADALGFSKWNISGDAVIVGEDSYDIQSFDEESRVSVLIYGDCSVIPEYTTCQLSDAIITDPTFIDGFTYWDHNDNTIISGGYPYVADSFANPILNNSFADGWTSWNHSTEAIYRTDIGFDDDYSVQFNTAGAWIEQTITPPIDPDGKSSLSGIFMAHGSGVVRCTTTYTDDSIEISDVTIANPPFCDWGQAGSNPLCIPYSFPCFSGIVKTIRFEWISGDYEIDSISYAITINNGYIEQTLAVPIVPKCITKYMLHVQWQGFATGDQCSGWHNYGAIDVIFTYSDSSEVTIHLDYSSNNNPQDDYIYLGDYANVKNLQSIKIKLYPAGYSATCFIVEMGDY